MPIIKSAKKALRVSIEKKAYNDVTRAKIKNALKGARIAVRNSDSDVAEKIQAAYRELDIASKKNVIHKNKAARLKSRLAKSASKATPEAPVKTTTKAKAKAKPTKTTKKK